MVCRYVFGDELHMEWGFDKHEFKRENIQWFADIWVEALTSVIRIGSTASLQRVTISDFDSCGMPFPPLA